MGLLWAYYRGASTALIRDMLAKNFEGPSAPFEGQDEGGKLTFFDNENRNKFMTCNVMFCTVKLGDVFIPLMIANENIAPNSQLRFPYGKDYWLAARMQPRYFYQDGSLIPTSAYRTTFFDRVQPSSKLLSGIIKLDPRENYDRAIQFYKDKNYPQAIEN